MCICGTSGYRLGSDGGHYHTPYVAALEAMTIMARSPLFGIPVQSFSSELHNKDTEAQICYQERMMLNSHAGRVVDLVVGTYGPERVIELNFSLCAGPKIEPSDSIPPTRA